MRARQTVAHSMIADVVVRLLFNLLFNVIPLGVSALSALWTLEIKKVSWKSEMNCINLAHPHSSSIMFVMTILRHSLLSYYQMIAHVLPKSSPLPQHTALRPTPLDKRAQMCCQKRAENIIWKIHSERRRTTHSLTHSLTHWSQFSKVKTRWMLGTSFNVDIHRNPNEP
jgi:hypothetical protein